MSAPLFLLLPCLLVSQEAEPLRQGTAGLGTGLGADPLASLRLAPQGCWDGLVLGASTRPRPPKVARFGEATVEVWDRLAPASPRQETFAAYLAAVRERLSRAWLAPPPKHQALELSEIMSNDPSAPQKLDLTKVKSMQERFNRLPPSGSAVK